MHYGPLKLLSLVDFGKIQKKMGPGHETGGGKKKRSHFVAHSSFQGRKFVSVKKIGLFGKLFEQKCFKFSLNCTG